ncbi:hypothetical protein BDN72DRAFT_955840 [Pluteus cervinus]|uniref:Uncharacterized protein n=1 Tax=Pluteus cervinus TaxID=181527 RepID=A0ACD3B8D8_9AGAR|nr:hypothetical protein BDN72DRAFT_955840 [Pluteus cervinus]
MYIWRQAALPNYGQATPPVPSSKFHFVRRLSLAGIENEPETFMLRECRNLTTLVHWSAKHASFVFNFVLEGNFPFLKHLSIHLHKVSKNMTDGPDAAGRLRKLSLSHIEFIGRPLTPERYSFTTNLPNLTHLRFFHREPPPSLVLTRILSSPLGPRLKVLASAILCTGKEGKQECLDTYEALGIDDIRFVCVNYGVSTYTQDRSDDLRGFGMWTFPEDIIEERVKKSKAKSAEAV